MARTDVTGYIKAWNAGDRGALDRLMQAAYPKLHAIASWHFKRERPDQTLQCTALVNETYLRLAQAPPQRWNDGAHFFTFAARMMRRILVDRARARHSVKRGGGVTAGPLKEAYAAPRGPEVEVMDLQTALDELRKLDSTQARVVELRCFEGLSIEESAAEMKVSVSTVKRAWRDATAWMKRRLGA